MSCYHCWFFCPTLSLPTHCLPTLFVMLGVPLFWRQPQHQHPRRHSMQSRLSIIIIKLLAERNCPHFKPHTTYTDYSNMWYTVMRNSLTYVNCFIEFLSYSRGLHAHVVESTCTMERKEDASELSERYFHAIKPQSNLPNERKANGKGL